MEELLAGSIAPIHDLRFTIHVSLNAGTKLEFNANVNKDSFNE
jgi:hypothetical protein